jgi:rhombotail lipoprotein
VVFTAACIPYQQRIRSNALEYLYPQGAQAAAASDVRLTVPVRVGVAFVPDPGGSQHVRAPFTETQKAELLDRVAGAFRDRGEIASIEVIPSSLLSPGGGFADLDRIRSAFGVDLIALVSYDQFQFSETGKSSFLYWTIVGAYVVKGEKNETRTVLDALIYDIPSRALLFQASGRSSIGGRSTPIDVEKKLRRGSEEGFALAMDDLIGQLDEGIDAFSQQAATGTVRGRGTPGIEMVDASGQPVTPGSGGAGIFGPVEIVAGLLLTASALTLRRRRRR